MVFPKIDWSDEDKFLPEKWTWLECLCDFNIPVGHINSTAAWSRGFGPVGGFNDKHEKVWKCEKGDVFAISYGEYQDTDKQLKMCLWGVYKGELQPCPALTPEFIEINEIKMGGKVFADVTLNIKRLQKLNQILK